MDDRCMECGCEMVRDYKCCHDCEWCKNCDPDQGTEVDENLGSGFGYGGGSGGGAKKI